MEKLNKIQSGIAGVYVTAGELSKRGFITSITFRNTKGIDILVSNEKITKTVGIQVKTNQGRQKWWILNEKAENYYSDNLFYIFVNLNFGKEPEFYIAPSINVASYIRKSHRKWMAMPSRKGQAHKVNSIRAFKDMDNQYLNQWDLLGL